jgi:cysteine-rich CPXCG protein
MEVDVSCPYCGEPLTVDVDESGGRTQTYVEDCAVCCQPMTIRARVIDDALDVVVKRSDD